MLFRSGEAADVPDILQIVGEDDNGERAGHVVFAEIEKVDAFGADLHPHDFSRHAFGLADMLGGLVDREAVGSRGTVYGQEQQRD